MSSNTFLGNEARIANVIKSLLQGMPGCAIERQLRAVIGLAAKQTLEKAYFWAVSCSIRHAGP